MIAARVFLVALFVILVASSHNRGGFISWKIVGPRQVEFSFTHAWRAGAPDYIGVNYGDGSGTTYGPTNMVFSGTDQAGEGYNVYTNTAVHTYSGDGPYTVYWTSCCRVGTLENAANGNFMVQTIVDLRGGYDSPISFLPPLLQFPISSTASYQIGVADPNGFAYSCRMATSAESSIGTNPAIGSNSLSVSSSCLLSWNTAAGQSGKKYAVSIMVCQQGTSTCIPLDFIIELVPGGSLPTCSVAPNSGLATVGQSWSVDIVGDSTTTGVTSLKVSALGLASDATLTPAAGSSHSAPFTVTLSVVPTQVGAYSTAIVFTDNLRRSVTCSVAYQVTDAVNCALVQYSSCSVANGKTTYSLTASNTADSFSWTSDCSGSFDSTTNSAVNFQTTTNPNSNCGFSVAVTANGVTGTCSVSASCPACGATATPRCRVDQPATHEVNDPASIDKYGNADVLAVVSDPDGAIISSTSSTLPPGVGLTADGQFYVSDRTALDSGSFNVTVTTTDVFGGVTTQVVTIVLLDITCGEGLTSCGQACYNPTVHDCFVFDGKRHMCLRGNLICNMDDQCCYNPLDSDCIDGSLCPKGNQKCDGVCFDPVARDCLPTSGGAHTLCLKGFQLCGSSCFDPVALGCTDGILCLKHEQVCGGGCFDPAYVDCVNNALAPKGHQPCGQTTYDPAVHSCLNGHTLCPVGLSLCGNACYNPTQYTCTAGFMMCPFGYEQCGEACFDEDVYSCCDYATSTLCLL